MGRFLFFTGRHGRARRMSMDLRLYSSFNGLVLRSTGSQSQHQKPLRRTLPVAAIPQSHIPTGKGYFPIASSAMLNRFATERQSGWDTRRFTVAP